MNFKHFICGLWRGETIYRISFHEYCKEIKGRVFDLCSGPPQRVYRRWIDGDDTYVIRGDRNADHLPDILLDADAFFPLCSNTFDVALLFNSIYILSDPQRTLAEIQRVLKMNGRCFVSSPFIFNQSQDMHDYARYTREGLLRLFREANFSEIAIHPFGERGSSAIYLLQPFFPLRVIRFFAYLLGHSLDALVPQKVRQIAGSPLGYFVVARK